MQRDDGVHARDLRAGSKITLADGVFEIASVETMDGTNGEPVSFIAGPSQKTAAALRINFHGRAPVTVHPSDVAKVSY